MNRKRNDGSSPCRKPYVPALGFHRLTTFYDPIVQHWRVTSQIRAAVIEALELAPGMRILELGAGPGRLAVQIKRNYPDVSVVAVDIDPSMVARTRRNAAKANVEITSEQADMTSLPNLGKFDRIFSTMTFHHLPPRAKQQALLASRTCLHSDGRFVVVDFSRPRGAIQWALFSFIQQPLDGFHNTSPHRDGRYEEVVRSSFAEVRSGKVWRTVAGTIELFVCSG